MANKQSAAKKNTTAKTKTSNKSSSAKKSTTRSNSKKNTVSNNSSAKSTTKNKSSKNNSTKNAANASTLEFTMQDLAKSETLKEVILWISLAVGVLLFLSNLGIGGIVGKAVSNFFFGIFGICAYLLPFIFVVSIFFAISNQGNPIATVKLIAGICFYFLLCVILELFAHGDQPYAAMRSFYYGMESHAGGGLIGGLLATAFIQGFGLAGAFILTIVLLIVCLILITQRSYLRKLGKRSRRPHQNADPNTDRNLRREKIKEDKLRQLESANIEDDTPRRERKISGVSFDTRVAPEEYFSEENSDEVNRLDPAAKEDAIVKDVNRIKLSSTTTSRDTIFSKHISKGEDEPSNSLSSSLASSDDSNNYESSISKRTTERRINIATTPVSTATVTNSAADNVQTVSSQLVSSQTSPSDLPEDTDSSLSAVKEGEVPTTRPRKTKESAMETQKSADEVANAIEKSKKKTPLKYKFPPLNLLKKKKSGGGGNSKAELEATADKLEQTLRNFGINVEVTDVTCGPTVTRYELQPEVGVRVNRITNLADDIKLNLAVTDIRMEAPIPGKAAVGIEVPNKDKVMVSFEELVSSKEFKSAESKVTFCAGRDIAGNIITANIAKMPHLLIAGTTGSGKSVCINTIIMSILYKARPDEVKFIMIDPKVVELSIYNGIPHLLIPVVTDSKKAAGALHWAVTEMDDRYQKFADASVRDIKSYNKKLEENDFKLPINSNGDLETFEKMPEMVVIVDELADLMMVAAKEVEASICRLAQKARAAGIYLILATQRPSVDVVTGLIKANMPSRIAFAVNSGVDSRTILDVYGAEKLLGNGDMLYYPQGYTKPLRVQGAFVSDEEVCDVVDFIKGNNDEASYNEAVTKHIESGAGSGDSATSIGGGNGFEDTLDSYFADAGRLIVSKEKASIGMLQRNFKIGFNRAARIMDQLEEAGVVGPEMGTKPRTVHMTPVQFEQYLNPSYSAVEEEYPVSDDF